MKTQLIIVSLFSFLFVNTGYAQKENLFSLQQTIDYAMKNATEVKNALIDIQIQKQTNKEVTSIALPQINSSINATQYFDIPTTTLPDFISPSVYNVLVNNNVKDGNGNPIKFPVNGFGFVPAKFGTNWNGSLGVDFSQILFDGQVFIGLKARAATLNLATQAAAVTKEQVKVNVYKIYYQLIVGEKQSTSIDANIDRFEKLLNDTKEIFKNGFAENLDVDKVEVILNNLKTEKDKINAQLEMGNAALKFLIGMPQNEKLVLSDTLNEEEINSFELSDTDSIDVTKRKEYQQLKTALLLNGLNVKRYQLSKYPSLVAFGTYSKNAQRNSFSFFDKGDWFSTSLIGVKLSMPLFDGMGRNAKIEKAKYELAKIKNIMSRLEQGIDFEIFDARLKIKTALKTLENQKQNSLLAEKVYNNTKLKYDQGVGSNNEIYTAQTELKIAQNNYYGALYDAVVAKVEYLKAIGNLP